MPPTIRPSGLRLPTIGQYIDSLNAPYGLFRTLPGFEVERDVYGEIRVRTGNNAAVFRIFPQGDPDAAQPNRATAPH